MPNKLQINIYDPKNKNYNFFSIVTESIEEFNPKFKLYDIKNKHIVSYLKFILWFCENKSLLSSGNDRNTYSVYNSDDNNYRINYFNKLTNEKGEEINTPCRINKYTGIIDVSKSKFATFTVSMCLIILLHEFAHIYINNRIDDEEECDYWGLLIYLGLGLPKTEAEKSFLTVFKGTPTDMNIKRDEKIHSIIKNFDNIKVKIM